MGASPVTTSPVCTSSVFTSAVCTSPCHTCLSLFSGPHGTSAPVSDYETILMAASGFGMVAQLPYLKQLIYGYNARKTRTRRVHLVWQLETLGKVQLDRSLQIKKAYNE